MKWLLLVKSLTGNRRKMDKFVGSRENATINIMDQFFFFFFLTKFVENSQSQNFKSSLNDKFATTHTHQREVGNMDRDPPFGDTISSIGR